MLTKDWHGLRRCDVVAGIPVFLVRDAIEVFLDDLFPPRKSIAPAHGKIMADQINETLALWHSVLVIICPHCGQEADDPKAALFDSISMGRLTCQHCGREFLVVDDVPMTEEQYRRGNAVQ